MMRIQLFCTFIIGIAVLFGSCTADSPTAQNAGRDLSGRVVLNTDGITRYDHIDSVTVLVGNRAVSADSMGVWTISGLTDDTVDVTYMRPGYGTAMTNKIFLPAGKNTALLHSVVLYNLPRYSVSAFTVTPFLKNGSASQGLTIVVETSTQPNYPDLRRTVIFFHTDSVVSCSPKEYLFQLELTAPGQFNEYWVSSEANKREYNLYFNQTLYAVAYPITGWEYMIDGSTGRKQYFNLGVGRSSSVKFNLP